MYEFERKEVQKAKVAIVQSKKQEQSTVSTLTLTSKDASTDVAKKDRRKCRRADVPSPSRMSCAWICRMNHCRDDAVAAALHLDQNLCCYFCCLHCQQGTKKWQ